MCEYIPPTHTHYGKHVEVRRQLEEFSPSYWVLGVPLSLEGLTFPAKPAQLTVFKKIGVQAQAPNVQVHACVELEYTLGVIVRKPSPVSLDRVPCPGAYLLD